MTPENFAYWLTGFFEMTDSITLDEKQTQMIKEHLNLVFNKVTETVIENQDNKVEDKESKKSGLPHYCQSNSKRKKINLNDILKEGKVIKIKRLDDITKDSFFDKFKPKGGIRKRYNDGTNKLLC